MGRNAEGYNRDSGLFTGGTNPHRMEGANTVGSSFNYQVSGPVSAPRKNLRDMNAEERAQNDHAIKTQHMTAKPSYSSAAQRQAPTQRRTAAASNGGMNTNGASYSDLKSGGPAVKPQTASASRQMPEGDIGTVGTKAYERNQKAIKRNSPGLYR